MSTKGVISFDGDNIKVPNGRPVIDYGDTLSCYKIISKNHLNEKNIHLIVSESEIESQIVIIYKNEKPFRLIKYRVDGNFAIGYFSKNVSIQ